MPSFAHEVLVDLFNNRPSLAPELLAEALRVEVPSYTEARVISIDITQIQPTEYRADVVVLLLDGDIPVYVLVVEVQLEIKERKRFTWPYYTTALRAKHSCPVGLLIVAPDKVVAAWCAEPIETGIPGFVLPPPVLGQEAIPIITDPAEAARRPELAVLSAMAHGEGELGASIAAAVLPAVQRLDDDRAGFYHDLVLHSLNEAARRALEAKMKGYEFQSDFAKKYVALGRKEGRDEGRTEGRTEGSAATLLVVLRGRGLVLTEAARERILNEKDPARLERWAAKAGTAATLAELLDEPN